MFVTLGDRVLNHDQIVNIAIRWWDEEQICLDVQMTVGKTAVLSIAVPNGTTHEEWDGWTRDDVAALIAESLNKQLRGE